MSHLFIGVIAPLSILVPIAIAVRYRLQKHIVLRFLFYYLLVSGVINGIAIILSYAGRNNLPLLHLLTLAELLLLAQLFSHLVQRKQARLVQYTGWVSAGLCVVNSMFVQPLTSFNSYGRGLLAAVLIFYSVLFLIAFPRQRQSPGSLYLVAGSLIYYSGSLFLFLFSNFLEPGSLLSTLIWNVNAGLTIVLYIFLSIGMVKWNKAPTISTSFC